jgi:hypothetical protein
VRWRPRAPRPSGGIVGPCRLTLRFPVWPSSAEVRLDLKTTAAPPKRSCPPKRQKLSRRPAPGPHARSIRTRATDGGGDRRQARAARSAMTFYPELATVASPRDACTRAAASPLQVWQLAFGTQGPITGTVHRTRPAGHRRLEGPGSGWLNAADGRSAARGSLLRGARAADGGQRSARSKIGAPGTPRRWRVASEAEVGRLERRLRRSVAAPSEDPVETAEAPTALRSQFRRE